MKELYIISILIMVCFNGLNAQKEPSFKIIAKKKSVELKEIILNNKKIYSIIQKHVLNEKIDDARKEYIYKAIFEQEFNNKFLMKISLVPPILFNNSKITGFFQVGDNYFIVSGQVPDKTFFFNEKNKIFDYEELNIEYSSGISMSYYSRPEEFTTWIFSYEKGKVKFIEKYN